MKISKNSWHYKLLDEFDLVNRNITKCAYVTWVALLISIIVFFVFAVFVILGMPLAFFLDLPNQFPQHFPVLIIAGLGMITAVFLAGFVYLYNALCKLTKKVEFSDD